MCTVLKPFKNILLNFTTQKQNNMPNEKGKLETWEDKRAGKETVRGEKISMNRAKETW